MLHALRPKSLLEEAWPSSTLPSQNDCPGSRKQTPQRMEPPTPRRCPSPKTTSSARKAYRRIIPQPSWNLRLEGFPLLPCRGDRAPYARAPPPLLTPTWSPQTSPQFPHFPQAQVTAMAPRWLSDCTGACHPAWHCAREKARRGKSPESAILTKMRYFFKHFPRPSRGWWNLLAKKNRG